MPPVADLPGVAEPAVPDPDAAGWHVYIVECADGSLYTGIARDPVTRVRQHNEGKGARYTRSRRPVGLVYSASAATRGQALRLEHRIKQLTRAAKMALIRTARRN